MTGTPWDGEVAVGTVSDDPEALRAQIEQTRTELGETVEALAARADVRARAREKLATVRARGRQRLAELTDRLSGRAADGRVMALSAAAAAAVLAAALVAWRRGRRG